MLQIKEVTLENIFGYTNKTFKFDKDQRTLIIGQNNSGKSAFADAICFILYGDWPRREKLSTVIKNGSDSASGTILFHNGIRITRTRNIRDEATLKTKGFPEIIGNRNTDKQNSINAVFGDYKTYIRTSYMMRGFLSIADPALKPAERRALLRQFFNIDSIDTATRFARSEKSQISTMIESKNRTIQTLKEQLSTASSADKKEIEDQLLSITEELKSLGSLFEEKEQHDKKAKELDAILRKIESLESTIKVLEVQKPDKEKEIESLTNSYKQIEKHYIKQIKDAESELEQLKTQYQKLNKNCPSDKEIAKKKKKQDSLSDYISENSNLSLEAKNINKEITLLKNKLENVPDAIACPECGTELTLNETGAIHREQVVADLKKQIQDKKKEFEDKSEKISEYSTKLEQFKILKQDIENIEEVHQKIEKIKEKGKDVKTQIETYKNSGKSARDEFNSNVERVTVETEEKEKKWQKEYSIQQALFADVINLKNDLEDEVKNLYKEEFLSLGKTQQELTNKKHAKEMELDRINEQEKRDKSIKKSIAEENKTISSLTEISNNVDFWVTHFPVVEQVLLEDSISLLELETNKWLQKLSDAYSIEFELKKNGVYTTIYEHGEAWSLNSMGSGISSRVALASTFALMTVLRKVNVAASWVFIDEALDNLDIEGVEAFADLMNHVEGQRFIISHHELLKNSNFDAIYEAHKTNKGSELEKI